MRRGARVLLVVDSLTLGGAERHVVDLAIALARRGVEPVVACSGSGPLVRDLERERIAVRVVSDEPAKRRLSSSYAAGLRRLLREERFDLVHAHLFASITAAAAALRASDLPFVITEQTEAPWRDEDEEILSARAHARAVRSIAVSERIARGLRATEGVPSEQIAVVPNTVVDCDDEAFAYAPPGPEPVVGVVARLEPEKGLDTFLRAAAAVRRRRIARFEIVGDGGLDRELRALATGLGLAEHVVFQGARDDARELIRSFDVFTLSSRAEGTPLTIVEAMRAGTPIAATTAGGIPEQIRHGRDGLLVAPGDHRGLAAAILCLLDHPAEARRLAAFAHDRATREFSHERMVDRVLAVYSAAQTSPPLAPEAALAS